jgi:RNA polymerase sigma factor (sigma-70 family)
VKSRVPESAPSSPPASDDVKAVNDFILAHEKWAKECAQGVYFRNALVERLGLDEAEGEAIYALWEAVQAYTPSKGSFEALAARIIRWHLIDAARKWLGLGSSGPLGGLGRVEPGKTWTKEEKSRFTYQFEERPAERAWRQEKEAAEQVEALSQALEQLPPRYRDVMSALSFGGKSIESLARKYGVHPSWIRAIRRRALQKLREILDKGAERGPFAQETDDASYHAASA